MEVEWVLGPRGGSCNDACAVAAPAVAALSRVLDDENRYVSSHTMAALQRIGTPEAEAVMLDFLSTARWCPLTTKESMY